MNSLNQKIYQRKIQEIANKYKTRGYKVLIEPSPEELPQFLKDFHPAIVAYGPQDSLVIEVRVGTQTSVSERYRELMDAIQQHPGWNFSLAIVDPESDEVAPLTDELLDLEDISARLKEAEGLFKQGPKDAAFILLWLSVEAILRNIAFQESLPLEFAPSSALVRELYSMGLLSRDGLNTALRAFSVRNSLVHGFKTPEVDDAFTELSALVPELLAELDQAGKQTA